MNACQICMDLSPAQGGLYRYIVDFSLATGCSILNLSSDVVPGPALPSSGIAGDLFAISAAEKLPCRARLAGSTKRRLAEAVKSADVLVVHSLYRAHVGTLAEICRATSTPLVIVVHGMLDPMAMRRWSLAKRYWLARVGQAAIRSASRVIFTTSAELEKAHGCRSLPNAEVLTPALYDTPPAIVDRAAARHEFGVREATTVLLYLNRYSELKRPLHVIRAFACVARPGATLVMAGFDGDITAARLNAEAARFPHADIRVIGPVTADAKWRLLAAVDAFVSFSARENFGYSFAESMWTGLPCVVSSGHDLLADRLRSAARDEVGIVVDGDDVAVFAAALQRFMDFSPGIRRRQGESNGLWARQHLASDHYGGAARAILERAAAGRRRTSAA